MSKPVGYPLPWCDKLDVPYWQINLLLIFCRKGWPAWQKTRSMVEIIPEIDKLIESGNV